MIQRLALGTVQFGLDYGINNQSGKVTSEQVQEILNICKSHGIMMIDTAHAYGNSEAVLGENGVSNFKIISKLPPCDISLVRSLFNESINRLKVKKVYAYMLHNFSIYNDTPSIWQELIALKEENKIEKIGISLYHPDELQRLLDDGIKFDILQIPYNLFDRRFKDYLPLLKSKGIEIHARSSFLQGLFFKKLDGLPSHFEKVRTKLEYIERFKKENNLETVEICLKFVMNDSNVDKVVIGVDSPEQLLNNISSLKNEGSNIDWNQLSELEEKDNSIINPSLWKV